MSTDIITCSTKEMKFIRCFKNSEMPNVDAAFPVVPLLYLLINKLEKREIVNSH